ncbi:MAG: methyltransferase domain-containing protein, partial [Planctomycetota bacterium]
MRRRAAALSAALAFVLCVACAEGAPADAEARRIFEATGVRGGLVIHVGCGTGELTAALRARDSCLVHGLDRDPANVSRSRTRVREAGLHGPVSFDEWRTAPRLPYVDDLARLIVVSAGAEVAREELLRVLTPDGVAYVERRGRWSKTVKPRPDDIDEWTHYLHGPDNNAVARDTRVGPPRHMQWLGGPLWTRNHHKLNSVSSVVTAAGRLFYIVDEATSAHMGVPGKWAIIARDAASGVMLWRKPLESWTWHAHGFRRGPPQVTRLLVTSGERLYAPLALSAPVSEIDAATGETLKTYKGTGGAEEI